MGDSLQDAYAKHLPFTRYGYPLRFPEPTSELPQDYLDDGLQIGDVGSVNTDGQFDVLFNICKHEDNWLHERHGVPRNFEAVSCGSGRVRTSRNAISPTSPIHSHSIVPVEHSNRTRSALYEFSSSAPAGAFLVLPLGAESCKLISPEQFRKVAEKNAPDWYEFAKKYYDVSRLDRSLYLVTGFYKARAWVLGSFDNPARITGNIIIREDSYLPDSPFNNHFRHSLGSGRANQTVFVTGFKISFSEWFMDPIVVGATESETTWSILVRLCKACFSWLSGSRMHKVPAKIDMEHSPRLTQPFHPGDAINHLLLSKNRGARVAITHDSQWMEMMEEGLTPEDLLSEERLELFFIRSKNFDVFTDQNYKSVTVLSSKLDVDADSAPINVHDPFLETEISGSPTSELDVSSTYSSEPESPLSATELQFSLPPTPSGESPWMVITCIRAQNVHHGLMRIPVGFHILVQLDGVQQRTQNKSIRVNDSYIEWEEKILLPKKALDKVWFTVFAPFELEPTLGDGEALYSSGSPLEELIGGTHLLTFPAKESESTTPSPSLLITLGRQYSEHPAVTPIDDHSNRLEESSDLAREATLGQEALLRYHDDNREEDLGNALRHFQCAMHKLQHHGTLTYRAAVLVNLAKAKLSGYRADPDNTDLDEIIELYREALKERGRGHPDRPATLIQLAQSLLFRYEVRGYDESIADEIYKHMTEPQTFPAESYERLAADLILDTLERYKVINSGSVVELEELVQKLKVSAAVPREDYFDRPQRLLNLGLTLWRLYEENKGLSELDLLLETQKQALQLLPSYHPDRLAVLRILAAALWELFELRGYFTYLKELDEVCEEASHLIPGLAKRRFYDTNSAGYLIVTSKHFGDAAFAAGEYDDAIEHYSQAVSLFSTPRG